MLLLGGIGLGWVTGHDVRTAGILLATFVFPLEFLSAAIAFLARDTAGAASLGFFSTSWLALGLAHAMSTPGTRSSAVGLFLIGFATMVLALAVATARGKPLLAVLLVTAAARAAVSGVQELGGPHVLRRVDGGLAVAIFVFSVYGGLALLLEDMRQRPLLPVLRIGAARRALRDDLPGQLERVQREAGVRPQL
jgi:succinate-acetate transporter protein